jgi:prepilin-type N-terminal cleavage/methylation domain-containing protein
MQVLKRRRRSGFTLIELLIVIVILALLAAIAFVALDPGTRFEDARDTERQSDVSSILSAIKFHQVDNNGALLASINSATNGTVYMLVNGSSMTTGCDDNNASCDTSVTADTSCVNVAGLVTGGYLTSMPVSPAGAVTWDDGDTGGEEGSGYTLTKASTGTITIKACESENTTEISIAR